MSAELILPLAITTTVGVVGWYAAHRLAAARDRANKRRELRVQYLIEAYRRLEFVSNRPITPVTARDFEQAIADIQLFGTGRQVDLARDFAKGFAQNGTHSLDPLLDDLRQSLRAELSLEVVKAKITYLRMNFDHKGAAASDNPSPTNPPAP
jgi:hypothetical protein